MNQFLRRIIGATALRTSTYEEIEADASATPQALAVVAASAIAAGIGARGFAAGGVSAQAGLEEAGLSMPALLAKTAARLDS